MEFTRTLKKHDSYEIAFETTTIIIIIIIIEKIPKNQLGSTKADVKICSQLFFRVFSINKRKAFGYKLLG